MKVTFIEEIEARKAFTRRMTCPKCSGFKYSIHHQLQPQENWWFACDDCQYETIPTPEFKIAKERWAKKCW